MNEKQANMIVLGAFGIAITVVGFRDYLRIRNEERAKRKEILNDMGLDVAAIHRATDVVNARIERGEIRSYEQLKDTVINEVAFQKITIREELN